MISKIYSPADSSDEGIISLNSRNGQDIEQDIAVVGMACRVAGGNNSPEQLWESLLAQKDASGEIPAMRWEPYYRRDARNAKELQRTTSRGYFLDNLPDFDASFFGISPKEAEMMDPQQRLTVEVTWEALEDAGIPPSSLAGSNTAVFMGVNSDDYSRLLLEDLPGLEAWMGIGTAFCGIPNRISYLLDLMGPSTAVDAACASSLVAIHHGRQSLLTDETNIAIVGGVNALCGPGLTRVLDKAGATSPEGCCRSFDDEASGYGRGEGASVIILKRLVDAIRDDDQIHAVLKGTAVAQDGRTNGIMAPNGKAQELVARNALRSGRIDPKTVHYVEAHATSTPVGDPIEILAMANVYGNGRETKDKAFIGSIKPNIGHLEAGAGAMGFMKAVLAVQKGVIPPQANLNKLNSKLRWDELGIEVARDIIPWPEFATPRRAAVSSYGYGGTVSHAVIENYEKYDPYPQSDSGGVDVEVDESTVLLLSAPQEKRLPPLAKSLALWMRAGGAKHDLKSIAATLALRRNQHEIRAAIVVENHDQAITALEAFAAGQPTSSTTSGRSIGKRDVGAVWVFSGHGAQWEKMGQDMLQNDIFASAVARIEPIVQEKMGFSAFDALKSGNFESSDQVQVLTYVMQIGLASVLQAKGISPEAIIGHSVGEIAASVVAGALSPEDGAQVVCVRARLYREVMGEGSMVLVNLPYEEVAQEIGQREDVAAAIDSSPSSCVVSGTTTVVSQMTEAWRAQGIKVMTVKSDIAFHSPVLNRLAAPLVQGLTKVITPMEPKIRLYSTSLIDPRGRDLRGIQYWVHNMVDPVRLTGTTRAAIDDGYRIFLEVSSHPIVSHSISETLMDRSIEDFATIPTMLRNKPARETIMSAIAKLYISGAPISWKAQMPRSWANDVPKTIWNHRSFWRTIGSGPLNSSQGHDVERHTLLGQQIPVAGEGLTIFMTKLDNDTKPFPGNHPLHGTEIVPAAVLLNTFLHGTKESTITDIVLRVPVAISAPRDLQVVISQHQVKITSHLSQAANTEVRNESWVTHTTGRIASESSAGRVDVPDLVDIESVKSRIGLKLREDFSIDYLDKVGVSAMGFPWAVTEHYGNTKEMIARVDVAPHVKDTALPWDSTSWAPILDAATSIGSTLFFDNPRLRMPAQVDRFTVYEGAVPPKIGHIFVQEDTCSGFSVHVTIADANGKVLAFIQSMRFSEIEGTPGVSGSSDSLVHQLAWTPAELNNTPLKFQHAVLVSKDVMALQTYQRTFKRINITEETVKPSDITSVSMENSKDKIVIYIPSNVASIDEVPKASETFCEELLDIVKYLVSNQALAKVFVVTEDAHRGETPTALAQSPLIGLARVIASEQPDVWGSLIDTEEFLVPLQAIKYVTGADVVKVSDTITRVARLRPLPREWLKPKGVEKNLFPTPEGTYLITGGLGALGLEVATYFVEKGARRLVLLSRRGLLPRSDWDSATGSMATAIKQIRQLEKLGATIYTPALDITADDADEKLRSTLTTLNVPPVLGVVHAAGVLEDQLILETTPSSFNRVLAPKIKGALALDRVFPAQTLDFFMLFSSCGQLFGFTGQGSYASGNAFLDSLAAARRKAGDNAVAVQWTSWRGLGMAASTEFINAELETKGITDVTRDEAFRAWEHVAKYDTNHGVVLRSMAFDEREVVPYSILNDIAIRRSSAASDSTANSNTSSNDGKSEIPKSGPLLEAYIALAVSQCVVSTLGLQSVEDVDPKTALSELGMDSVMTVGLRRGMQKALNVVVPPTLIWAHPTVGHLTEWFYNKLTV